MNRTLKLAMIAVLGLGVAAAAVPQLRAEEGRKAEAKERKEKKEWKKKHPRRAEVNKRLANQNKRVRQGVKSGKLDKQQAQQLHQEDKAIRQEERADAKANGGHITKQEQKDLNQQENAVSKQIYDEKHAPATPANPQQ